MSEPTPDLIEQAHAAALAIALDELLEQRGFGKGGNDPLRAALVHVAARFAESVARQVNAAPDAHRRQFTRLLGTPARQPEAARAHLIFKPAKGGSASRAVVPAGTGVAAAAGVGGGEPPVFETQTDLVLVNAEPVRAVWVAEHHARSADATALLLAGKGDVESLLAGFVPIESALHIGEDAAFATAGLRQVIVHFEIEPSAKPSNAGSSAKPWNAGTLEWGMTTNAGFSPLTVADDSTHGLSDSGAVTLIAPPAWPKATVAGRESRWLTLRVRRPAVAGSAVDEPKADEPKADEPNPPPRVRVVLDVVAALPPVPLTVACCDGVPLDTSKDFFPLGEMPRFGTVFQLLSPAFGQAGARIDLQVSMTNPVTALNSPIPRVSREGLPKLAWEIGTTDGYHSLAAIDGTWALTQDGTISFTVPDDVMAMRIGGQHAPCVRARLASGHYRLKTGLGTAESPASAPAVRAVHMGVTLRRERLPPQRLVSEGALVLAEVNPESTVPFALFPTADQPGAALYVALAGPDTNRPGPRRLALHVKYQLPPPPYVVGRGSMATGAGKPRWQVGSEAGWHDLATKTLSEISTESAVLAIDVPQMTARWPASGLDPAAQYLWLRAVWPPEVRAAPPCRLGINAVEARHLKLLRNEILGSSTGRPRLTFRALRPPILGAVTLQVREDESTWVHWHEVDDVAGAAAADRSFSLERLTGEIRFGDGRHGCIPPVGGGNIRLSYCTGGGTSGNVAALAITQMRTTLPGVDSVVNIDAAAGGVDADAGYGTGPEAAAWLRHRDRAICAQDYVDLALRASPHVARAYVFMGDVSAAAQNPAGELSSGAVSVVVLSHGSDAQPQPTPALLSTVKAYLDARRTPLTPLIVMGPRYAAVSIELVVTVERGASAHNVTAECVLRLQGFLHPLSGGSAGRGWALGQRPHKSDLYGVLGAVAGVAVVRTLVLRIDLPDKGPFITSAGVIEATADE